MTKNNDNGCYLDLDLMILTLKTTTKVAQLKVVNEGRDEAL